MYQLYQTRIDNDALRVPFYYTITHIIVVNYMYQLYQTRNDNEALKTMKSKRQKMYTNTCIYW